MNKRKNITTMAELARLTLFNAKKGFDCTMVSTDDVEKTIKENYIEMEIKSLKKLKGEGVHIQFSDSSKLFVPAWVIYGKDVPDESSDSEMIVSNFVLGFFLVSGLTYLLMGGPYY